MDLTPWKDVAENLYKKRSKNHRANKIAVQEILEENEEMFAPLMERCPGFDVILSFILENRVCFRIKNVGWTSKMTDWGEEECKRVGRSLVAFIFTATAGEHAVDAWRLHYAQLNVLFEEVVGFEEFMLVIANNLLRDSIYGMVLRVSLGALLSTVDAVTDIYVISTYYKSAELVGRANIMLAMVLGNIVFQFCGMLALYRKKGWSRLTAESIITALFLRPAVDAYRVSTSEADEEIIVDQLSEMLLNKSTELACESVPGCVLQLFVWLSTPELAGSYALVSIGISCLTTGFTSAMISFDMDVDVPHRRSQPKFYGYIPNESSLRTRCFILMILMSSLHNLSRSLGYALLAASGTDDLVLMFIGGEIGAYLLLKIIRQDFYSFFRFSGMVAFLISMIHRTISKVIVDFTGCLHFRHPYELGGWGFTISLLWAQVFPFVALLFFPDEATQGGNVKEKITMFLAASFLLWLTFNIVFFCTIDLSYLNTFFGTKTAPQYTCELFLTSKEDHQRFHAVFKNRIEYTKSIHRIEYTKSIHGEVKEWVVNNLRKWRRERPDWFKDPHDP